MKAWLVTSNKDEFLGLKKCQIPIPKPKSNEILVKVLSVSLNYRDYAILNGTYQQQFQNLIPCSDVVGKIVEIGNQVSKFKVGDRVMNNFMSCWLDGNASEIEFENTYGGPLNGGLSEFMVISEDACLLAPNYLNDDECSTLPIAALTSWYSLIDIGNLKQNQWVLIEGTGGVSLFALQIAHAIGANSIVLTSSSDSEKLDRIKKLGATHIINYNQVPKWDEMVLQLTNGKGVDHVLEVVGGNNFNLAIRSSKQQGHIYSIGFLKGSTVNLNVFDLISKRINIHGIGVAPKSSFVEMVQGLEKLHIKPVIDTCYDFDNAIKAFQHLKNGSFGKLVIHVNNSIIKPIM